MDSGGSGSSRRGEELTVGASGTTRSDLGSVCLRYAWLVDKNQSALVSLLCFGRGPQAEDQQNVASRSLSSPH